MSAWHGSHRVRGGGPLRWTVWGRGLWVGGAADPADPVVGFLKDQGYIVETGSGATGCATYLSSTELARGLDQVRLIESIESSAAPLVRFWRWPSSARSALCVTGDLDALSLTDYAARLFAL